MEKFARESTYWQTPQTLVSCAQSLQPPAILYISVGQVSSVANISKSSTSISGMSSTSFFPILL